MRTFSTIIILSLLALAAMAQPHAGVIATDFVSSGAVSRLDLSNPWDVATDLETVHHDAVGIWHDGLIYVVNRAGADNIQVLDPENEYTTIRQFSLGLGRNLQHMAFHDDGTAYVSCYDTAELLHIDPADGTILQVISTALFADADGLPETGWVHLSGDRLFVTCQRLDRDNYYSPVGDSYLLVLDTTTNTWVDADQAQAGVQGILLAAANPYTRIVPADDHLLIGCNGYYVVNDGGVAVVDPSTLTSLGLEISEDDLGGDIVGLASGLDGRRHVVISDASFHTAVKAYTIDGVVSLLHQASGYDHADIAYDGDFQILVADRKIGAAGVRIFDAASGAQLTSTPLATGLPPAWFVIPSDRETPVLDLPTASLTMAAPWPNPANPSTTIAFRAPSGTQVTLRLIDLRGRLVRQTRLIVGAEGSGTWTFDGRDRQGRQVASGVYRCVAEGIGSFAARSLTIVR